MKNSSQGKRLAFVSTVGVAVLSTGCSTGSINKANETAKNDIVMVEQDLEQGKIMSRSNTKVRVIDELFVAGKPFRMADNELLPKFFDQSIVMNRLNPVNFQEIVDLLQTSLGVRVDLTNDAINYMGGFKDDAGGGADSAQSGEEASVSSLMSGGGGLVGSNISYQIDYEGTVAGLLDHITAKANLFWKFKNNHIKIFRLETKQHMFDGDINEMMTTAGISSSSEGGDNSDSGSSSSTTSGLSASFSGGQKNYVDVISASIESMLSPEGRYNVAPDQGVITVTDTPEVQEKIDDYLTQMNAISNKQIALRTEIFDIAVEDSGEFGVNLANIKNTIGDLTINAGSQLADPTSKVMSLGFLDQNSGTSLNGMISSLNTVSNVSKRTDVTSYIKNGRTYPVQVAKEEGYLSAMTPVIGGEDDELMGFEMVTSSVLSGLTMNITPKVNSEGRVDLTLQAEMSNLDGIVEETSEIMAGSDLVRQSVSYPNRSMMSYMQSVIVPNGRSLVVTGFERTINQSDTKSVAGEDLYALGGNKKGGTTRVLSLMVITPYIMSANQ